MSLAVEVGILILWVALLLGTGRVAYFYGVQCGRQTERLSADRRVRGVLSREKKAKNAPANTRNTRKKKAKSSKTTIKVGEVEVPALVVKARG